jgi:hypothetical protein
MFAHIQTWFPFAIHIYVNGREWLARQMDTEKLSGRTMRGLKTNWGPFSDLWRNS